MSEAQEEAKLPTSSTSVNVVRLIMFVIGLPTTKKGWLGDKLWYLSFTLINRLVGGISLLAVSVLIYRNGFPQILVDILRIYDESVSFVFCWTGLTALAEWISSCIREALGLELTLQSHWKHVMILLGLYFFREGFLAISNEIFGTAVFNFVLGAFLALTFSIGVGLIQGETEDRMSIFLVAVLPVYAAEVYHFLGTLWDSTFLRKYHAERLGKETPTWSEHFKMGLPRGLSRTLFGLTFALVCVNIPVFSSVPNAGLAIFAMIVLLFGIYWLIDAISLVKSTRDDSKPLIDRYLDSDHAKLGAAILGAFLWATLATTAAYLKGAA